jgi:lipopolysaccharide biosynthesis glycosyltransferase
MGSCILGHQPSSVVLGLSLLLSGIGLLTTNATSNPATYNICNGLSNQLLYHSASIAVAVKKGKDVLIPDNFIVNGVQHTDAPVLPTRNNSIPFGDAFDQAFFLKQIQQLGIRARLVTFDAEKPQIPCDGMKTIGKADPRIVLKVLKAFRPSEKMSSIISSISNKIKDKGEGICVHHRDGQDWHDHCARWGGINDGVYRGNCLGVPGRTFLQSLEDRGLTDSRWIYYCGDHAVPEELSTSQHVVLSRDDLIDQADTQAVEAINSAGQPGRDLWALIDFYVCGRLEHFIGNSVSTFSGIQIALRDGDHAHWYNSQSIPLGGMWKVYQVPIVYTYTELSAASGKHLLQVSISSVRQKMPLNKIHVIYHGDTDEQFWSWLENKGVIIHQHDPTWRGQIETMRKNGDPSRSHLFLNSGNYFGTWQRIDIPLFIDSEYCLLLDADTIVVKPFTLSDFGLDLTPGVAMSAEFIPDNMPHNAGVTLMNVPHLRNTHTKFLEFILGHLDSGMFLDTPSDQGAYLEFYKPVLRFLPRSFNFKPYWSGTALEKGRSSKGPFILHFHGAKPHDFLKFITGHECHGPIKHLCELTWTLPNLCEALQIFARASKSVDEVAYCNASFTKVKEVASCNYLMDFLVSRKGDCQDMKELKKAVANEKVRAEKQAIKTEEKNETLWNDFSGAHDEDQDNLVKHMFDEEAMKQSSISDGMLMLLFLGNLLPIIVLVVWYGCRRRWRRRGRFFFS